MRAIALTLGTLLAFGFLVAVATPTEAVAICVGGVVHPIGYPPCGYVYCYGYTSGAWQNCQYPLPDPCFPEYCDPPL